MRQSVTLHLAALGFFLAAAGGDLMHPSQVNAVLALAAGSCFAIETYFAVRAGLDARVLSRFADKTLTGGVDLEAFDKGLRSAGLVKASPPPRSLDQRMAASLDLFRRQSFATAGAALLAAAIFFHAGGRA